MENIARQPRAHVERGSRRDMRVSRDVRHDACSVSWKVSTGACWTYRQPLACLSHSPRQPCATCARLAAAHGQACHAHPCAPVRHSMAHATGNMCGARAATLLPADTLTGQIESFEFSSPGSNKLTGSNYLDWLHNLKIVLASEKLLYTLEKSPMKEAPADVSPEELTRLEKRWDHVLG
ncbi:hypothetical protein F511_07635 [Dorcoceras hygrometricum]|uniref:Uncharacterized protein n=1 Tax=Dorcoceras hygrometricum TaxID=472368 RepID=A0A2Z7DGK0_9LAMI|nr:hypothetical protein F511_07635 [Dorcoceras hygrometricum]